MSTAETKSSARQVSDVSIERMTEHDLLEVVEIEEASGLSRWGWAAYYAELQGGNRDLLLVAKPAHSRGTELAKGTLQRLFSRSAAEMSPPRPCTKSVVLRRLRRVQTTIRTRAKTRWS